MKIEFTVLGKPAHQQRHRHFRRENFSGTYDPSKEDKKDFLWVAMSNKPKKPILTPITLNVEFYFPRPKSPAVPATINSPWSFTKSHISSRL